MRGSLDIGSRNGGLLSNIASQTEYRPTDENWLAYKRGQGQEAYDKYIADLTDLREHVLPYLQSLREPENPYMKDWRSIKRG